MNPVKTPPPATGCHPAAPVQPPDNSDELAQIRSIIWFDQQCGAGKFEQYIGMFVAIRGEEVIDADRDGAALGERLAATGEPVPRGRVAVRYVPTEREWELCRGYFAE